MRTDYKKRILIPHNGDPSMRLFTSTGLLLAGGYTRIEFGDRGPYLELSQEQIQHANIHRAQVKHSYYDEFRSNCGANVKVYLQRKRVDYADYRIGLYYISPSDLRDEDGMVVIAPLERKATMKEASSVISQEIEAQLPPVLQEIETTGFQLNTEILDLRIAHFKKHKEELRAELVEEFNKAPKKSVRGADKKGRTYLDLGFDLINFDNDQEVIAALNGIQGVNVAGRGKVELRDLAESLPAISKICELLIGMNHCDAMIHNHGECWREKAVNGYLYPKHKSDRTDTGRLKSDFQQWQRPERIPGVPELREILSPRPGMTFVYTDFSQIEVRIAAQESGDDWLLAILNSGEDVHARIIADTLCKDPQAFLTAYKDPTHPKHQQAVDVRSTHKGATFNILYGATARGMAESLGISTKRAEEIITKFFSKATALRDYAAAHAKEAVETNQVTTPRGFERKFNPEVLSAQQIARRGMNTPIQSGCADLLKLSMIYMREEFRKPPYSDQEPAALLANSMHDEVIAQAYPKDSEVVKECMDDALHRAVDELFPGIAWDFLKEIKISDRSLK